MNILSAVREYHPNSVKETLSQGHQYRFGAILKRAVVCDVVASNPRKKVSDICMEAVERENIGYKDYEHAKKASPSKKERMRAFFKEASSVLESSSDPEIAQAAHEYSNAFLALEKAEEKFKPIMNTAVNEMEKKAAETAELLEKSGDVTVAKESFEEKLI